MSRLGFSVLASGSKGNCLYVEGPEGSLIVDAGLSAKETLRRLDAAGADPERIRAVLITHEHSDHLRGVRALSRRLKVPVFGTNKTLLHADMPDDVATVTIEGGQRFQFAGFDVLPFSIPHDAREPVGFLIERDSFRFGIATDLGYATNLVKERLKGCSALILESNHDEGMLMDGPYPWFLKQRIRGRRGHLSNASSAKMLQTIMHSGLQRVVLAHLSEENNTPDLALTVAREALEDRNSDVPVEIASAHVPTPLTWLED